MDTAAPFNPFPGLRSFEPEEEHLFFGREIQVDELLGRLARARFLSVVGSSGSGKSSLVRSGLIPALHGGYMVGAGSSWRIAILRPGDDPIGNLAAALDAPEVLGGADEPAEITRGLLGATLRRGSRGLVEATLRARLPAHENLLLVVDQFEELFRFKHSSRKSSDDEAAAFVKLLLEAAASAEVPIYTVLTLRSDFLGNCVELQGLPEAINQGLYLVPRLTRDERRAAIAGPVAVAGGEIAPRLLTRLLNDVGEGMDQLPILQHALMRTWDYWLHHHGDGEPLDLRHYESIGTMKEALSLHAEEIYAELAGERLRRCAERLFRALTEKGEEGKGTRRPMRLGAVCEATGFSPAEVGEVVERFRAPGRSFLMPPLGVALGEGTILDISHESLMRVWTRLRQWVDEEARSAQLYLRLARAAAHHQAGQGGLWRDPGFQLGLRWREENQPTAAWAEQYDPAFERAMIFLDLSREDRERELGRHDRAQRLKLRRARQLAVGLGLGAFLVLLLGVFALLAKGDAERAKEQAEAVGKVAEMKAREANTQRERIEAERIKAEDARLAAETAERSARAEKERADRERAAALQQKDQAEQAQQTAIAAREQAETSRVAAEQAEQEARQAQERSAASEAAARKLRLLEVARRLGIEAQRLVKDGRADLAALAALEAYRLERRERGDRATAPEIATALRLSLDGLEAGTVRTVASHREAVRSVVWSPDGKRFATAGDDGELHLLRLGATAAEEMAKVAVGFAVRALAWSPDGRTLALGGLDGSLSLYDPEQPGAPRARKSGGVMVGALAFSPSGDQLAVARRGGRVELVTVGGLDPQPEPQLGDLGAGPSTVAWSRADGRLAAAGSAGRVVVQPGAQGPRLELAAGGAVHALAWSPDGRRLAAGSAEGPILIWSLDDPAAPPERRIGHVSGVGALSFGPGGNLLLSASADGTLRLWDLGYEKSEPSILTGHGAWVWSAALSPDGRHVLSGSADRTAKLWAVAAAELAERVCGQVRRNMTAAEWAELLSKDLPYQETCPGLPGR